MFFSCTPDGRIPEILPWNRKSFLAHRIRISEILPWDRKSDLTHAILPRLSFEVSYFGCIHRNTVC